MAYLGYEKSSHYADIIEKTYTSLMISKLSHIIDGISDLGVECLVFPEYSIPAAALHILYDFAQRYNCICVCASHSVQIRNNDIYKRISMDLDVEKYASMSCCPVMIPGQRTIPVFKKHKSKWEQTMEVENETYDSGKDVTYLNSDGKSIAITICIDALKSSIDTSKTKLIICPAATPSTGEFVNKFSSYLSQDIPSVFCNSYEYGKSTIYCHCTEGQNIPFSGSDNCIVPMGKYEETVAVFDIDIANHKLNRRSVNNPELVVYNAIIPLLYRDNDRDITLYRSFLKAASEKNYEKVQEYSNLFKCEGDGLLVDRDLFVKSRVRDGALSTAQLEKHIRYIQVNDFSLIQYEVNWVRKLLYVINDMLLNGQSNNDRIMTLQSNLYTANSQLSKRLPNIIDIAVFDESTKMLANFQNRGSELQEFRDANQDGKSTFFILYGFPGIGKSALIERIKSIYKIETRDRTLPKSAGFESLIKALLDLCNTDFRWDSLDDKEIDMISSHITKCIADTTRTIFVIRSTGSIFEEYYRSKSVMLLSRIAQKLAAYGPKIRVFIETCYKMPEELQKMDELHFCKIRPLKDVYMSRLIEQTTNQITFDLCIPEIPREVINECKGNPTIGKRIGVYLGQKINANNDESITRTEIADFSNGYIDGVLEKLQISGDELELLREICVFRIPVPKTALSRLPHFRDSLLESLVSKMTIENTDEGMQVDGMIWNRLHGNGSDYTIVHRIAAEYYDEHYRQCMSKTSKAEYFFHISFSASNGKPRDAKFYSDDIMAAAFEMCDRFRRTDIALSHFELIKKWKDNYWKFNLYYSYCLLLNGNYQDYAIAFEHAIVHNKHPEMVYYIMISKLIDARMQNEAENLLNIAEDKYGSNKQLRALWIKYRYSNANTRRQSIEQAISLSKEKQYDLYGSKILVSIFMKERLQREALFEIDSVSSVWPGCTWASKMRHVILTGSNTLEDEEDEISDDAIESDA